jgi:proteasome lid subunit RPN8/RPN11
MKTEVCGVLIGENLNGVVEVRASIEASNAAQAGTHVTFTQDAWEEIYKVKDVSYPDERIVGWYHSHPGFGVFLSEHDTFIHRNFFSNPDQVAWVYDPHTDEEGCFGWVAGDIHRIHSFSIVDNNGDGVERTPKEIEPRQEEAVAESQPAAQRKAGGSPPAWMRWSVSALTYVTVLVLGFAISYFLFPKLVPVLFDPETGQIMVLPDELARAVLQKRALGPAPAPQPAQPSPQPGQQSPQPAQPAPQPNKPAPDPNPGRSK